MDKTGKNMRNTAFIMRCFFLYNENHAIVAWFSRG